MGVIKRVFIDTNMKLVPLYNETIKEIMKSKVETFDSCCYQKSGYKIYCHLHCVIWSQMHTFGAVYECHPNAD